MDISQILGGGGGGGMAGMNAVGGLGGLGGMRMGGPGISGIPGQIGRGGPRALGRPPMAQEQMDPRLQNATPEQLFDPGGRIAHFFGGTGAMNPVQAALVEQRQGGAPAAGPGFNPNAMMGLMQRGQQPQPGGSPLRGAFGRAF